MDNDLIHFEFFFFVMIENFLFKRKNFLSKIKYEHIKC